MFNLKQVTEEKKKKKNEILDSDYYIMVIINRLAREIAVVFDNNSSHTFVRPRWFLPSFPPVLLHRFVTILFNNLQIIYTLEPLAICLKTPVRFSSEQR